MKGGGEAEVMGGCCLGRTPGTETEAPGPGVRLIPAMADMTELGHQVSGAARIKPAIKQKLDLYSTSIFMYACLARADRCNYEF